MNRQGDMARAAALQRFNQITTVGHNNGAVPVFNQVLGKVHRPGLDTTHIKLWDYLKNIHF
jgi:hypothetical protein